MAPSLNLHLYYTIFPFFVKDISPTKKRAVDRPASEQHAEYVFGSPAVLLADSWWPMAISYLLSAISHKPSAIRHLPT